MFLVPAGFIKYGNNRLDGLGKPPENLVRSNGPLKLKNNNLLVSKSLHSKFLNAIYYTPSLAHAFFLVLQKFA